MTGNNDPDDGWADLARELGLEQPARPPAPSAEPHPDGGDDPLFTAADGRQEPFPEYEAEGEDAEDADDVEDGEPAGEPGEEGPKKKKRRRRRRKKKSGEGGEVAAIGGDDADDEGDDATEDAAASDDEEEDEEEPAGRAPVDDGGPTAEASRELIANWDVPSWEQIVAGLYRPGGR